MKRYCDVFAVFRTILYILRPYNNRKHYHEAKTRIKLKYNLHFMPKIYTHQNTSHHLHKIAEYFAENVVFNLRHFSRNIG